MSTRSKGAHRPDHKAPAPKRMGVHWQATGLKRDMLVPIRIGSKASPIDYNSVPLQTGGQCQSACARSNDRNIGLKNRNRKSVSRKDHARQRAIISAAAYRGRLLRPIVAMAGESALPCAALAISSLPTLRQYIRTWALGRARHLVLSTGRVLCEAVCWGQACGAQRYAGVSL